MPKKQRKLLIRKEKKEFIKELNREVIVRKGKLYFIEDPSKDYHCQEGIISKKDLKKKEGSLIKSNKKDEFILLNTSFIDEYRKIGRLSQLIPLKDLGHIVAITGINKNSRVVDAGAGSGGLACFLANICKEVTTYDLTDESIQLLKKNKSFLNLTNLKIKKKNILHGIDEKNIDLITLDIPNPWNALKQADKALKIGGFLTSYSPQITQVMDFVNTLTRNDSFIHLKTIELLERAWTVKGRILKPKGFEIHHSGFITFARKIK